MPTNTARTKHELGLHAPERCHGKLFLRDLGKLARPLTTRRDMATRCNTQRPRTRHERGEDEWRVTASRRGGVSGSGAPIAYVVQVA
jgi:hypothetical protein